MKRLFFLLMITMIVLPGCNENIGNTDDLYNSSASLSNKDSLPFNPLEWRVITVSGNKHNKTMSTLYGNPIAADYALNANAGVFPKGAVLAMVTWIQKEDKHWFGAEIPGNIQSVEIIKYNVADATKPSYEVYTGSPLRLISDNDPKQANERMIFIASQRALVTP